MYEEFYRLKAEPFRLSPDHKFCFGHKGFQKARAYMAYALRRAEGFVMITGQPGTGKTMLAHAIAENLKMPLIVLNVKSSMKLVDALYQYDTLTRLNDSRFGDSSRNVSNIEEYIKMGKIGQAFTADQRTVLLIDEIDKAPRDFPNDLLHELDQMEFKIIETGKTILQAPWNHWPQPRDRPSTPRRCKCCC